MTESNNEQVVSRRNFMRNLGIAALAATTAGTSAALLSKELNKTAVSVPVIKEIPAAPTTIPPVVRSAQTVVTTQNDAAELLAHLAESQAENMRLQAALDAAQRDLASLTVTNDSNRSATEDLSYQLADATSQIGILSGLVALYEQLDGIDVTESVQTGIATVSENINEFIDQTPTLSEGIALGHQALTEVEEHLPTLEDGRIWLDAQSNKLTAFYESVEVILQGVLETVGSFLDLVENWFAGVRKWLPFGIDEKAAMVINSLSDLVAETPHTINGMDAYIAQPLDVWLMREEDTPRLQKKLIKPIREQVLAEASATIDRAHSLKTVYQEQLALPVEATISNRNIIRDQIINYRQQNQV